MEIGSKIHPRNGKARRVEVHGRLYVFAATPDNKGNIHFVADVTNEQHAETFLGSGDFYAFGKDLKQQPALTRSAAAGKPVTGASTAAPASTDAGKGSDNPNPPTVTGHDPEAVAAATELLKGSISDVGKAVANQTLPVIRAALDLEKAQPSPRKGMVTLLESTLEGARQAGVEG